MKSESPFQKITFSAFLFLLKLSVSHNDHEMLSSIRNTLFTESLQIEFIIRNSVVSCHPLPHSHTGLALNSAWECLGGEVLCLGSSVGTGCHWRKVGPRFGSSLKGQAQERTELWHQWPKLDNRLLQPIRAWQPHEWPGPWAVLVPPTVQLETQTFLLGLSRDSGQNGSCWPCPYHCHIVMAVS